MKQQKSYYAKPTDIERKWYIVDATDKILGRLASEVAGVLRGKNKATFTPSVDVGDFVVVINSDKIKVTGAKETDKKYYHHTGYPGGIKETSLAAQREKDSSKIIYSAVKGMLPSNRLGRQMLKKVKIYTGAEHPHDAQQPSVLEIK